jgi:hypothetical protein
METQEFIGRSHLDTRTLCAWVEAEWLVPVTSCESALKSDPSTARCINSLVPIGVGTPRRLTASTPRAQRTGFPKAWATSSRSAANLSQTPDLPVRLRIGAPLNVDDPTTYYGGGEKGYTDYPSLEQDRGNKPKACVDQR